MLTVSLAVAGQTYSTTSRKAIKRFEEARTLFQSREDGRAEELLRQAIRADDRFVEAYQMLAQINYDRGRLEEAITYFSRSLEIDPVGNPEGYRLLAGLVIQTGDYERSGTLLEEYFEFPAEQTPNREAAQILQEKLEFALRALQNPVPFIPENLGDSVNSPYNEYWPCLSVDEQLLMFTVMLPVDPQGEMVPRNLQEDFFISRAGPSGWTHRQNAGSPLNTGDNEGAHTMTADGRLLFFTACNRRDGKGQCDIYFSRLLEGKWSRPKNLGSPVNSRYSEKHPTISADGRSLYFSSDRPGGKGSYDLWHSRWEGNGWSTPENLGYPINTHSDEIGLSVSASGDRAYFASDRGSGGDTDLFTFTLPEQSRPVPVSYVNGRIYDSRTMKGVESVIQLIDLESGEAVMEVPSNAGEGDYLVALPTDRNYALNVSSPGYLFHSEHFSFTGIHDRMDPFRRDVAMERIRVGSRVILKNIFFDTDSYRLKSESMAELAEIHTFLTNNPGVHVEISGYTDSTGNAAHNQQLSEERARAVVNHLTGLGIEESRMTSAGYGDRQPLSDNRTEEGRAMNRRTELKIVGVR